MKAVLKKKAKIKENTANGREEKANTKMQSQAAEEELAAKYLVTLIRCALHHEEPMEKPENCAWQTRWHMACRNNVESTISPAIQMYQGTIPEPIAGKWKSALSYNLNRFLRFEVEREYISQQLDQHQIAWLPLKGILIAEDYPVPGMRWMSDNDILYGYVEQDASGQWRPRGESEEERKAWQKKAGEILQELMTGLVYTAEYLGGHHDVYQKPPIFNFEMHQSLVPKINPAYEYYRNPWAKALRSDKNSWQFHFRDEDAYIFHIVHAYKHFEGYGCGIRTLVDEYVILQNHRKMDRQYILGELQKLHLEVFEKQLRRAAVHAFSKEGVITEKDWQIINYMLGCGTYGNLHSMIQNKMTRIKKENGRACGNGKRVFLLLSYIRERLHVDESTMEDYFNFFYRHKKLRFLLPFWRIGRGLIIHPKKLLEEWKIICTYK